MTEDARSKIIERIAKLLNLANATDSATVNEMEVALTKAHRLMEEYNIKLGEVAQNSDGANGSAGPQYTIRKAEAYAWPELRDYQQLLMNVVAKITKTEPVITHGWGERKYRGEVSKIRKQFASFVGDETDVAVACAMYPQLIKTIHTAVRIQIGPGYGRRQRSYCEGFVMALWDKVRTIKESNSECLAMVVAGKQLATRKWMDENLNIQEAEAKKRRTSDDYDAHVLGYIRGQNQDLGTKNRIS